jgi:menaquinol-cytochrome c reductase iron-sulfur subunit
MSDDPPEEPAPDRRRFLQVATCAIGGGVGLVAVAPVLRLIAAPANLATVTMPTDPLDIGNPDQFKVGAPPRRVDVIAPVIQDAWSAAHDVVLGSAWVRRTAPDKLEAFSAVCPHLGCSIGWDAAAGNYLCPCHDSRFDVSGGRLTGPAERGLDPLPIELKDGRLQLRWLRYKMGGTGRELA